MAAPVSMDHAAPTLQGTKRARGRSSVLAVALTDTVGVRQTTVSLSSEFWSKDV